MLSTIRAVAVTWITASWIQRHRLGQILLETKAGRHNPHYVVWFIELTGPLDIEALNDAWVALQRRYPVLLYGFDADRERWNVGLAADPSSVTVCSGDAGREAVEAAIRAPFVLDSGPLCRLVVAKTGLVSHLLAVVVDHLVCDGRSMDRLISDLSNLYLQQLGTSEGVELAPPGPNYVDFVRHENGHLDSSAGLRDIEAALAAVEPLGVLPGVMLPGFTNQPGIDYTRHDRFVGRLEAGEARVLKKVARNSGLTLAALLTAAMHQALAELSANAEIGTPVVTSNRRRREHFGIVGWMATKFVLTSQPLKYRGQGYLNHFRHRFYGALRTPAVSWQRLLFEQHPEMFGNFSETPYITFNAMNLSEPEPAPTFAGLPYRELPIDIGGRDDSINSVWVISEGVDVCMKFKSDWYSHADIHSLWSAIRAIHRRWQSDKR